MLLYYTFLIVLALGTLPVHSEDTIQTSLTALADTLTIQDKLPIGSLAPDFTLPDQSGNPVSLHGFKGSPVVIYFYPKDNTPGCTQESCDFRDNYALYQKHGAIILGISPDSVASHVKFIAGHSLPFTLLADTEKTVLTQYGVWGRKSFAGKSYDGVIRSTVVIDREGKVANVWSPVSVGGHVAEVLSELEKISK